MRVPLQLVTRFIICTTPMGLSLRSGDHAGDGDSANAQIKKYTKLRESSELLETMHHVEKELFEIVHHVTALCPMSMELHWVTR